jgi:hypothetical protein
VSLFHDSEATKNNRSDNDKSSSRTSSMTSNSTSTSTSNRNHEQPENAVGAPPQGCFVATPHPYEIVIEDLKQRGMAALAAEILRSTTIGIDAKNVIVDSQEAEERDKKQFQSQQPQTVMMTTLTVTHQIDNADQKNDGKTSSRAAHPTGDSPSGNREEIHEEAATSTEKEENTFDSSRVAAPSIDGMIATGLLATELATRKDKTPGSGTELPMTDFVSPPSLVRNDRSGQGNSTSSPGAFAVTPMLPVGDNSNFNDASSTDDEESTLANAVAAAEEGMVQPPDNDLDGYGTALEAVRVDDIMTVKAEPLSDDDRGGSKLNKAIACVACAVVALVLIMTIAISASRNSGTNSGDNGPMEILTYDTETRFQLIQNLLLIRMGPLYSVQYNTASNGTLILQDAFQTRSSPQYRALDWVARQDPFLESIPRPSLDDYQVIRRGNNDSFGGERRRLSRLSIRSLPIHDRIVQRYALAVILYSTGNWTNSFEFLSAGSECDWSGALQCSSESGSVDDTYNGTINDADMSDNAMSDIRVVTHLHLPENNLEGSVPLEMAALSHLESLSLSSNLLTGTLPSALAALSVLHRMDVGFNKLTGTIPTSYYQNWGQLEAWIMSENDLTGTVSSYIGNLVHLKELRMERNHLGGTIPPQLWYNLTKMEDFDLSQQLEGEKFFDQTLVTEIGLLSNLKTFVFHNNEIHGTVPTELGLLVNLTSIQIAGNHLSGPIPSDLGELTALTLLSLSLINALTGTVPTDILKLTELRMLYLQNTWLTGNVSFLCEAIEDGLLPPMDPMRVDMGELFGCSCCTCCLY